jgi:hypothetical protein
VSLNNASCKADWSTIIMRSMAWRALPHFISQQHDGQSLKSLPAPSPVSFEEMEHLRHFRSALEDKQQVIRNGVNLMDNPPFSFCILRFRCLACDPKVRTMASVLDRKKNAIQGH